MRCVSGSRTFYYIKPGANADDIAEAVLWARFYGPSHPQYAEVKRELLDMMSSAELDRLPEYLNPSHLDYNPRIAGMLDAVRALKSDPKLSEGRSKKAAAKRYFSLHARKYGLIKADGTLNELAIEEMAKTVNPERKGGAPRTPERKPKT
jgi:hypothetical protein